MSSRRSCRLHGASNLETERVPQNWIDLTFWQILSTARGFPPKRPQPGQWPRGFPRFKDQGRRLASPRLRASAQVTQVVLQLPPSPMQQLAGIAANRLHFDVRRRRRGIQVLSPAAPLHQHRHLLQGPVPLRHAWQRLMARPLAWMDGLGFLRGRTLGHYTLRLLVMSVTLRAPLGILGMAAIRITMPLAEQWRTRCGPRNCKGMDGFVVRSNRTTAGRRIAPSGSTKQRLWNVALAKITSFCRK